MFIIVLQLFHRPIHMCVYSINSRVINSRHESVTYALNLFTTRKPTHVPYVARCSSHTFVPPRLFRAGLRKH